MNDFDKFFLVFLYHFNTQPSYLGTCGTLAEYTLARCPDLLFLLSDEVLFQPPLFHYCEMSQKLMN